MLVAPESFVGFEVSERANVAIVAVWVLPFHVGSWLDIVIDEAIDFAVFVDRPRIEFYRHASVWIGFFGFVGDARDFELERHVDGLFSRRNRRGRYREFARNLFVEGFGWAMDAQVVARFIDFVCGYRPTFAHEGIFRFRVWVCFTQAYEIGCAFIGPLYKRVDVDKIDVFFGLFTVVARFVAHDAHERFVGDIGGDFVIGDDVIASIAPTVGVVLRGADDVDLFAIDFGQIERCEWKLLFDLRFAKEG